MIKYPDDVTLDVVLAGLDDDIATARRYVELDRAGLADALARAAASVAAADRLSRHGRSISPRQSRSAFVDRALAGADDSARLVRDLNALARRLQALAASHDTHHRLRALRDELKGPEAARGASTKSAMRYRASLAPRPRATKELPPIFAGSRQRPRR